jgi:hypothetical protein
VARGESAADARAAARAAAPRGAAVSIHRSAGLVVVEVRGRAGLPGRWAGAGGPEVTGRAVAAVEDTAVEGTGVGAVDGTAGAGTGGGFP